MKLIEAPNASALLVWDLPGALVLPGVFVFGFDWPGLFGL